MTKKLHWFKFDPANWMMGKIQRCPDATQARFICLCCLYWNKGGSVLYEDAEVDIESEHMEILIKKKIVTVEGEYIHIDFLDEQLIEISSNTKERSESGKIGNLKRWQPELYQKVVNKELSLTEALAIAKVSLPDRPPIATRSLSIAEESREEQNRTEQIRGEEKREDSPSSGSPIILREDQILQTVLDNFTWIESLQRHFKNTDLETIQEGLKEFISELALKDELHKGYEEIKRHFFNWFKIDLAKKHKAGKFSVDVNKGLSNNTDYDELSKHDATQGWDPDKD